MDILTVVLCAVCTLISCIGVSLHASSIYLLNQPTTVVIHQKLLLVHFSSLEIANLILCQVVLYVDFYDKTIKNYIMLLFYAVGWCWVHVLVVLTIDRFLRVRLSITYEVYVKKNLLRMVLLCCYLLGILLDVAVLCIWLHQSKYSATETVRNIFIVHGVVLITMFLFSYAYISYTMYSKRTLPAIHQSQKNSTRDNLNYFVPFLIVISHTLFVITPNVFYLFYPEVIPSKYHSVLWRLLWTSNFTADAVICILLNIPVRNMMATRVRRITRTQSRVETP